ncbi:putative MFS family arabinose efflux permease [Blastococcus colisei]|uniref:Putative MFS family arabinose efflux permease n=1 Tax=Blastococcus colisei TaxID=1564162 RepID=A0A543P205_9ACTN|nr:MFS transporter [Blastococcus colisei]TQN38053.1 putative MFS family arabinose efflux permease [Blastococcus colisei]
MTDVRLPRWLLPLLVCAVFVQTALHLARPLVTYRVIGLGGDALAVGLVTAAFAVLPLAAAMPLGRLTDRLRGLVGILTVGLVLSAGGTLFMSMTDSLVSLAATSAVLGLGQLVYMLSAQGIIARWSGDHLLDRAFGLFTAAVAVGQLVGPLLVGALLGDASGTALLEASRVAFWVAAGIALLSVPVAGLVAMRVPRMPRRPEGQEREPIDSSLTLMRYRGVGASMYASLALLSTVDILTAYLPLIGERRGISPMAVGVLLAVRSAATISSRLLLDVMLRWGSRERLIVISAGGSAVALAVVPIEGIGIIGMGAAMVVGGFLLGVGQPLTMSLLAIAVPANARSSVLALRMVANRVGQVAVPGVAGVVAASAGAAGAWWLSCVVLATAAVVSQRGKPPERPPDGAPEDDAPGRPPPA